MKKPKKYFNDNFYKLRNSCALKIFEITDQEHYWFIEYCNKNKLTEGDAFRKLIKDNRI